MPVCAGDFGRIRIEQGVNIQDCCIVHGFPERDTVVEENGHIGHGAVLHCCRDRPQCAWSA
jgi:phenylacetic acid degradation protein